MIDAEFNHPRLVGVYDLLCPWGPPDDFFMAFAGEQPGSRILDLGCGTGRLALALAEAGHTVTGVDPALASLEAARAKPGAQRVNWLCGTSTILPKAAFDLAVMNSHVAQFMVSDNEWASSLADLRGSLLAGGRLAFDSRNPRARGWEAWNPTDSFERVRLPGGPEMEYWVEVVDERASLVSFVQHYRFLDTAEELLSKSTLRFRSEEELRHALSAAGFEVEHIFGGWRREPIGHKDGEFIVVARAG